METPSTAVVAARPAQQRGLRDGNPGNKGGGRRPSELRRKAREGVELGIKCAMTIMRSTKTKPSDKLQAAAFCERVGLGERIPRAEIRERVLATVATLRSLLPAETADDVVTGIKRDWEDL